MAIFGERHRRHRFGLIGLVTVAFVASGLAAFGRPPKGLDELQGHWVLVSSTAAAEASPVKRGHLEFKGDSYIRQDIVDGASRAFKIDATRDPMTIDETVDLGSGRTRILEGVFEVTESTLVLCHEGDPRSGGRPSSLEYVHGRRRRRDEFERRSIAPPKGSPTAQLLEGTWIRTRTLSDTPPTEGLQGTVQWVFHDGVMSLQSKLVMDGRITLQEGSARADLSRIWLKQTRRSIVDYSPETGELKICSYQSDDLTYPSEFASKKEDRSILEIYKREVEVNDDLSVPHEIGSFH